jgi:hypothetical protein
MLDGQYADYIIQANNFFMRYMTPSEVFLYLKTLKSTPKCHNLTLEVLKVNIFRFKMQNDPIWAYNQMVKSHRTAEKSPK